MKSSVSVLYPNERVSRNVTAYSESSSTPLPAHIVAYHDHIDTTQPETSMLMISNFQAQNHIWLAKLIGAKRGEFCQLCSGQGSESSEMLLVNVSCWSGLLVSVVHVA